MKTATKGDKPDWFERPDNVVGVNVCRVSGKLPNSGCGGVVTVNDDGSFETKSMIYTDYFVKGTQPTTVCPLHPSTAVIIGDASGFRIPESGPPHAGVPIGTAGTLPTQPPGISGGTVQPPPLEKEKTDKDKDNKKKKGFWGRIFGRGGG